MLRATPAHMPHHQQSRREERIVQRREELPMGHATVHAAVHRAPRYHEAVAIRHVVPEELQPPGIHLRRQLHVHAVHAAQVGPESVASGLDCVLPLSLALALGERARTERRGLRTKGLGAPGCGLRADANRRQRAVHRKVRLLFI
eukprot:4574094-Prymnesium_polylepis.1